VTFRTKELHAVGGGDGHLDPGDNGDAGELLDQACMIPAATSAEVIASIAVCNVVMRASTPVLSARPRAFRRRSEVA
jgi:hypothetical protein